MKQSPVSDKQFAISVSNYQYSLLREAFRSGGLTLKRVLEIRQTTGGSLVRRGLLQWRESVKRFTLSSDGLALLDRYENSVLERKDSNRPLSKFIEGKGGVGLHGQVSRKEVKRVRSRLERVA